MGSATINMFRMKVESIKYWRNIVLKSGTWGRKTKERWLTAFLRRTPLRSKDTHRRLGRVSRTEIAPDPIYSDENVSI